MKYFYRILAAFNCVVLLWAGVALHIIPEFLGRGFVGGVLAFTICFFFERTGVVFYCALVVLALVLHSWWAAIGFFFSPFLAGGMHWLVLLIARYKVGRSDSEIK